MSFQRIQFTSALIFCHIIIINLTNSHAIPLRRSCGTDLTRRIADICSRLGGYNVLGSTSLSTSNPEHHHRVRRRVADECCKNICSDAVISQYCYNSSEKIPRAIDKSYEANYANDESMKNHRENSRNNRINNNNDDNDNGDHILLSRNPIYEIHYQPVNVGTVAPEYTKTAMTPQLLSRINVFN